MFRFIATTFLSIIIFSCGLIAQTDHLKGWHLLDSTKDAFYGISLNKAYEYLQSKKKIPRTVVVAVLDSGVDTTHEDLKKNLWHNPKEIPGNGIDDDKNGYIDDVYGWNFLGGKDGRSIKKVSDERARVYHKWKEQFLGKSIDTNQLNSTDKAHFAIWQKAAKAINFSQEEQMDILFIELTAKAMKRNDIILRKKWV